VSYISGSTIQEVNNRIDAVALVGEYVRLEKKGGRWWGRCPFHGGGQERTPSFKVDPGLKTWYCFGCGRGDGVINFIMEMEKLSYPDAIKALARKMGIEIVYEDGNPEPKEDISLKEELFELYRRTTITFQHFLHEKPEGLNALKYIKDRGISDKIIGQFRLGFSPGDRNFLYFFLKQKGYSEQFLDKSGLFSSRYKAMSLFSGRLMFPIADRQSRVVAFGGRAMPGDLQNDGKEPPKYINSPELETYKKGQTLYAIDLALPEIRLSKTVYLAEGYMDVIALHQAGITNAVAPLGTAFTGDQAKLLQLWAEKAVLVFDTHEAGIKAAYKAILTCRKAGLCCALAQPHLPVNKEESLNMGECKDPADIFQKFGPQILNKIMKYTINDFEYLIHRAKSQYDMSVPGGKNSAAVFLFPYLETLDSEIERDDCIAAASAAFRLDRNAMQTDYSKRKMAGLRHDVQNDQSGALPGRPIRLNRELFLLAVITANPELYPEFRAALDIKEIDDPAAKELFIALEECYRQDEYGVDSLLRRIGDEDLRSFIIKRAASPEFCHDPRRMMEDGINGIRKEGLRKRLKEIDLQMQESERGTGGGNINELLAEKMLVDSQIRTLKGRK
jgi:DNA primase